MIPVELFTLECEMGDDSEDSQRKNFLNHFELHEGEGTAIAYKTNAVCWYLKGVFKKGDSPREKDDSPKRPRVGDFHLGEFQMTIPCEGHKYVAANEQ